MMFSRFPMSAGAESRVPKPRGNTLVLVTVILVLLVIIAVAFISRTQGGRVIAAAQRKAIDREDRAEIAVGVVQKLVGADLFPGLVDWTDPLVQRDLAASSATPTLSLDTWTLDQGGFPVTQEIVRYGVDPSGFDAAIGAGSLDYPYNFAPFQTIPWTNWPDVPPGADGNLFPYGPGNLGGRFLANDNFSPLADSNPIGNPGFGDSRWLRSSEPQRSYENGQPSDFGRPSGFSHWTHLSWIATAENGIRVCKDITNIATFEPNGQGGGTIATTFPELIRQGYMGTYYEVDEPLALQTPYEQWLPGNPPFSFSPLPPSSRFLNAREAWFGSPSSYANAMYNGGTEDLLPNFIHLESLGPKSDEGVYLEDPDDPNDWPIRKAVASTFADADGDGFTDSFWFVLPGVSEDGIRQVAAVSIIDNASMVDVNTATRFDRWSTAGHTPADVALTSKLFAEWPNGNDFDTLDTLTGLLSDPQNGTFGLFPGCETDAPDLGTSFDPGRFDGIFTGGTPFAGETSWTDEVGVTANGNFIAPYRTPLAAFDDFELVIDTAQRDRRRYFQRRLTNSGLSLDRYDPNGEIWKNPARFGLENIPTRQFANGDELELRMFAGNGYGPIVSRLERTIERPWGTSSVSNSNPDRYRYNPLRSTLTRVENVSRSFVNDICAGHQLDAEQLLFDTRHRMTTYSATRNDLVPLHQRPTPLYVAGWIDPSRDQMEVLDDYAFGRIMNRFSRGDVLGTYRPVPPGAPLTDTEVLLRDFSEKSYRDRSLKLDLRAALDGPITAYESVLYSENPEDEGYLLFPHGVFNPINRIPAEERFVGDLREGLWPGQADIDDPAEATTLFKEAIEIDREIRFRQRLESILAAELASAVELDPVNFPGEYTFQSYLQDQYAPVVGGHNNTELEAFIRSSQMAASWAANIDCYRDGKRRGRLPVWDVDTDSFAPVYIDQPIWPEDAPVMPDLPVNAAKRLVGMEPQPFLMESFFALVYPPSRFDDALENDITSGGQNFPDPDKWLGSWTIPDGDNIEWPSNVDEDSKWFDEESKPAIVFAIQLANPYDVPVPLHDLEIQIGDNPVGISFARGLPSPHPMTTNDRAFYRPEELYLGPTLPDAPRTAIIFGVIPPSGIGGFSNVIDGRWLTRSPDENGDGQDDDPAFMFFDPAQLGDTDATEVLSPTGIGSGFVIGTGQPDEVDDWNGPPLASAGLPSDWNERLSFYYQFGMTFEEFRWRWMDFLDIEPGALFGWEPGLPLNEHQTLVFDASPISFPLLPTRSRNDSANRPVNDPLDARPNLPGSGNSFWQGVKPRIPTGLSDDPDVFFGDSPGTVRLVRTLVDPLNSNRRVKMVIDRFDPVAEGSPQTLGDTFERLTNLHDDVENNAEHKASYGQNVGSRDFAGWSQPNIDEDVAVVWARAGRAWGWDVNRNGVYDLNEVSPRYVFSSLPEASSGLGDVSRVLEQDELEANGRTMPDSRTKESLDAVAWDLSLDPDGVFNGDGEYDIGDEPWFRRAYAAPLGYIKPYRYRKPGFFTTSSYPLGVASTDGNAPGLNWAFDSDAGFPFLPNGELRTGDQWEPGPGVNSYSGWASRQQPGGLWVLMDKGQEEASSLEILPDNPSNSQPRWIDREQWVAPLQMAHKNGDIEQIGEILNAFLWGHIAEFNLTGTGGDSNTILTFSEIMNNPLPDLVDDSTQELDQYPVARRELDRRKFKEILDVQDKNLLRGLLTADGWTDPSLVFLNRYQPDQGHLDLQEALQGTALDSFRPSTPVMSARSVNELWRPSLPAGLSIFDSLVCDGPGSNYTFDLKDNGRQAYDQIAFDEEAFSNAAGFSGRPTRGLINLNTASPEVLRTLPHMSRLISNDREQWLVTDPDPLDNQGNPNTQPNWIATVNPGPDRRPEGDLLANGKPNPNSDSVNPQWTRIPESIVRYRDGDGTLARVNTRAGFGDAGDENLALPAYLDRGWIPNQEDPAVVLPTVPLFPEGIGNVDATAPFLEEPSGFFPGMRRGAGIASAGELLLLQRPALNGGVPLRGRSSPSMFGLLGDPYARQNLSSRAFDFQNDDVEPEQCNLGWRPRFGNDKLMQADARLATDRTNIRWDAVVEDIDLNDLSAAESKAPPEYDMEIPDSVAGDAEEAYLLFSGISNLVSVRSDTFTAYIQIKSFKQNPVTGIWDAMDPEYVVDDSRYVFQIDRSNCERPSDAPLIRMLNKVPSSMGVSGG